jgi:hypothetical protein
LKASRALVSSVLAWAIFCLCYGAGYGLLLLASFAMHGAQPWHYLSQGGAIGALLGGGLGLWREGHRWTARIVWKLWSLIGMLAAFVVDHEGLSRRHDAAPLLAPVLMLGASACAFFILRRALRPERPSRE